MRMCPRLAKERAGCLDAAPLLPQSEPRVSFSFEKTGLLLLSLRCSRCCESMRKPTELPAGFFRYFSNMSLSVWRSRSTSAWALCFSLISKAICCRRFRLLPLCMTPPRFPLFGMLRNGESRARSRFPRELFDLVMMLLSLLFLAELFPMPTECSLSTSALGGVLMYSFGLSLLLNCLTLLMPWPSPPRTCFWISPALFVKSDGKLRLVWYC